MDYRNSILSSYYSNLVGSIIVNGSEIEVGTKISKDADNFIMYFIAADDDRSTYDDKIREIDINIDCVSIQPKNRGDDSGVDSMVEQVKEIIGSGISLKGWKMDMTREISTVDNSGESDVNYIVRRTITYKHFIWKR